MEVKDHKNLVKTMMLQKCPSPDINNCLKCHVVWISSRDRAFFSGGIHTWSVTRLSDYIVNKTCPQDNHDSFGLEGCCLERNGKRAIMALPWGSCWKYKAVTQASGRVRAHCGQLYGSMPTICEVTRIIQHKSHLLANSEEESEDAHPLGVCSRRKGNSSRL